MKKLIALVILVIISNNILADDGACWIWYPGDLEVWLHTKTSGKRQQRGQPCPPFWRVDSPYGLVGFQKSYEISDPDTIKIFAEGQYQVRIDGELVYNFDVENLILPAGRHSLRILVENYDDFPCLMVEGREVNTDETWLVSNQNKKYYTASIGSFNSSQIPPTKFSLEYAPIIGEVVEKEKNSVLIDFGKETIGKVIVEDVYGTGELKFFYGETKEEAISKIQAETFDFIKIDKKEPMADTTDVRAFRYIYVVGTPNVSFNGISALYEYLPVEYKGDFECSDTLLNKIYDVATYTLHLNTREFHVDGIKRDRWVWSGDAYQSYLMNFYTFFDEEVNKRTLFALRGHDPVETHINTILDYSFYWLIGVYNHFLYTGDTTFVQQIYPRMKTLMNFCLLRTNKKGLVEGLPGDWVFVDWADMEKDGEVSFEQLLLARSLEATSLCANLTNDKEYGEECKTLSVEIRNKISDIFWSEDKGAFLHNRKDNVLSETVTRYANMFAILFDYIPNEYKNRIGDRVLLNDNILPITTPYMKFYELEALCEIEREEYAVKYVKDYWGGMLKIGATTFWEKFDPGQSGVEHYAMYGRPFGKSLCHAWGAGPVYLFGKYLLGVKPLTPGYKSYAIEPSLAGLDWIKGKVPTPNGNIEIYMNKSTVKIKTIEGEGMLILKSVKPPRSETNLNMTEVEKGLYHISLTPKSQEYKIRYYQ